MTTAEISTKNTKNEVLDAYHDVLQQLKEAKKTSKQEVKREQEKQEMVQMASQNTADEIVKSLANLKLFIVHSLEELANQLLEEHKKLVTLRQAIKIQEQDLEELHEIKVNTDTLAALLQAQKQKKESFEREMSEQRQTFEQEMSQKDSPGKKNKRKQKVQKKNKTCCKKN